MTLITRKKLSTNERALRHLTERTATEPEPKSRLEVETEIFTLASVGGDGNAKAAYARLRQLTPRERRQLRRSIETLDSLLDDVALDLHFARK